jgi:hypothetical protein
VEEAYEKKAAKYLDAASVRHTESDLWKLREKRVQPEDAVEALSQARSPKEMRQDCGFARGPTLVCRFCSAGSTPVRINMVGV